MPVAQGVCASGESVRLLLAARSEAELDGVYPELAEAYEETARQAPAYREWLERGGPGTPVPALP